MRPRVLVALALLVAGLLALRARQREEASAPLQAEAVAFPGLERDAIGALFVEHLELLHRVGLERDAAGAWYLTEPVAYPAESAAVEGLIQLALELRGVPVEDARLPALGLDPPRAVVRFRAGERAGRIEIGAFDVDGVRAFVRAIEGDRAVVLRARRDYASRIDMDAREYRDRRATPIEGSRVITLRRRGSVEGEDGARDLLLDALLDPERGWIAEAPFRATLDPVQLGFLARGTAEMRVEEFVADDVVDFARYGLDAPRITVEIESELGERAELLFAPRGRGPATPEARWLGRRAGFGSVWGIESRSIGLISLPALDLVDALLVRALRDDVQAVRIGDVRLERAGGGFAVARGDARFPADQDAARDLLGRLEFASVERFDPALALGPAPVAVEVELRDGRALAFEIAPAADGRPATFRRRGDTLVGELAPDVAALIEVGLDDLRSRRAHALEEHQLAALVLEREGASARFVRDPDRGTWSRAGAAGEVGHAFYSALERLLLLEGDAWVEPPPRLPDDALRVRFEAAGGKEAAPPLALARDAKGRLLCVLERGEALSIAPELEADLRALLQ